PDGEPIDQVANVVAGIRAVVADPTASVGRRLIVSAWNPAEIEAMALPPCHTLFQFNVTEGRLSCQLYQRSADLFLGVPFNIASYALLTCLIARATGLEPGEFVHTFGDAHIYTNHLDQVDEQLTREPLELPAVEILGDVSDLGLVTRDQIRLVGYKCWPALRGEVAV
ncbi:MAG: thymidylate synthase, partial [Planctomycetales bacterium 71-10]